jgi:predicted RNA-binding protein with PUA domain
VIGESALVCNSRQWSFGSDNEGCGALHELDRSILAKRHAIRLAKLARQVNRMNVHDVRQSRYRETLLRVVHQTARSHCRHSIRVNSWTNRGEQLRQRILIVGD